MSTSTRFTGTIPALYERHLGPVLFEPYARAVAERISADRRRGLELAAGTGRVTRRLLERLAPDATLIASDFNEPMLAEAQSQLEDPRLHWHVVDAQQIPFEAARFDLVVCQFGLMFVPDPPRALREMRRVLDHHGLLVITTWGELAHNPACQLLDELAHAELPTDPPTFMRIPFSMGDPVALAALVEAAGFSSVETETVAITGEATSAADLATGFVRGNPLWNQLVERGIDADAFHARVATTLARAFGDRPCRPPMAAHIVRARVA
jgi:SAM-dependent methyltransferase